MSRRKKSASISIWRLFTVRLGFVVLAVGLGWRLVDLQIINSDFLRAEGAKRHVRQVSIPAHRGMILDRHGVALAVSTPAYSVWIDPQKITTNRADITKLSRLLGLNEGTVLKKINNKKRRFIYLKRRINPDIAQQVDELNLAGAYLQKEYRRYYPVSEVTSHLIGFTNIDDKGQEGLELAHDDTLLGVPGSRLITQDRRGRYVGGGKQVTAPKHGKNIQLSIDLRIQHLAYQALKKTVDKFNARSGSVVVLDIKTGEVLAMVNHPSFNPNNRQGLKPAHLRNRAVTDLFEPGSTIKPFIVVIALKSGEITPSTLINTSPGTLKVGGYTVKDYHDYGKIDIATVIQKSSNVAASKIALAMKPENLWQGLSAFGVAEETGAYFPGEVTGSLPDPQTWVELDRAVLAYGYGVSMSALQLAKSYMVLANGGVLQPVSFIKRDKALFRERVFDSDVMQQVLRMMERVTLPGGTAPRATVDNYTVAGKTGTVKKAIKGGYADNQYVSLFAGIIPARQPRLATVVIVDNPKGDNYYGGVVAAPVFSEVMTGAMRLLNIPPDNLSDGQRLLMAQK